MGKSTTAGMFADAGVPVWDADAAVHRLYAKGGAAVTPIEAEFPSAISDDAVDRDRLKYLISKDKNVLRQIEAIVHPLVAADRQAFLDRTNADMVLLDIPLLFETGADSTMDSVVCVSAPPDVQRARVMARPGMTAETFETILKQQLPDAEKRARADYVIETTTMQSARAHVAAVLEDIKRKVVDARDRS